MLICSDHPAATNTTVDIVRRIPDMRPLDAGELSNAAPIEAFAAVLLQLNVRYKTRAAVQVHRHRRSDPVDVDGSRAGCRADTVRLLVDALDR